MSDNSWYYKEQLRKLKSDNVYNFGIVVSDSDGNKTKQMNLNVESIEVLQVWLNKEFKRLTKNKGGER